jgi:hypothetical protein
MSEIPQGPFVMDNDRLIMLIDSSAYLMLSFSCASVVGDEFTLETEWLINTGSSETQETQQDW